LNNLDKFFTEDAAEYSRRYIRYLNSVLEKIDHNAVARLIVTLLEARTIGGTVFIIGNGGSASTASHFANDLAIGTKADEKPFRAISLTDNVAILTAIGNDLGYVEIFVTQLRVLAKQGDILLGISASGNSPNLLKAFKYAKAKGKDSCSHSL